MLLESRGSIGVGEWMAGEGWLGSVVVIVYCDEYGLAISWFFDNLPLGALDLGVGLSFFSWRGLRKEKKNFEKR